MIAKSTATPTTIKKPMLEPFPGKPPVFIPQIPEISAGMEIIKAAESKYFIK